MKETTKNEIWIVRGKEHDCGAKDVEFRRESETVANRSATLLRECGYQKIEVEQQQ